MTGAPREGMDSPPTRTAVERAARQMRANIDDLIEQITERVWRAVPSYGDILIERTGLEHHVRPNIVDALDFMSSGKELGHLDRIRLNQLGRSRALQGVPLAAMIQSFRIGERVLIDAFCRFCIQSSFNSAEQRSGILAISAIMDKLELATIEAYSEMQRQLQQEHHSTLAALVNRLVDGTGGDRMEIDTQAWLVGADPAVAYRCVALRVAPTMSDASAVLAHLRRHLVTRLIEARIPTPVAGEWDNALVLLVPASERDALTVVTHGISPRQYRHPVTAGAGDQYPSLFDARASCREAISALDVGMRQRREHQVVRYADVVIDVMLLRDRDASRRLVETYLRALDQYPPLVETLRVYLDMSLSAQATAEALVVHVNTIAYRLRRIRELTGYDAHRVSDALHFSLALRALDLLSG